MNYCPGKFSAAMRECASTDNEQNVITLATDAGEITFKQIAGLIARRVVCWKKPGDRVAPRRTNRSRALRLSRRPLAPPRFGAASKSRRSRRRRLQRRRVLAAARKIHTTSRHASESIFGRKSLPSGETNLMAEFEQQQIPFKERRLRSTKLRRGFFLLPAIFTVGNLLCGYYACVASLMGGFDQFDRAAKAIGFAILFDSLDGRVARMTGTSSEFGVQFDSLADVVSFGVAPALMAYAWGVRSLPGQGHSLRRTNQPVRLDLLPRFPDLLRLAPRAI